MFSFCNTVKVFYDDSPFDNLIDYLKSNNYKKLLILTGTKSSNRIAERAKNLLCDFEVCFINGIVSNPLDTKVCEIVLKAKSVGVDAILSIGGGSVHDTAKAVSIMYFDNGNTVEDYTVNGKLGVMSIKKVLPIITIPTLIGSGAEVSPAALIRIGDEKRVIFSPLLHPVACFLYESILSEIPYDILARSMYDSFIQALEGFISIKANSLSKAFSLAAMRCVINNAIKLKSNVLETPNYEELSVASILGSYVASLASVGAVHALSDPLSGIYDIHHADALHMVAVPVLAKNFEDTKADISEILKLFGFSSYGMSRKELIKKTIEQIDKLGTTLIKFRVNDNFDRSQIDALVKGSFNSDMDGNPHDFNEIEIREIFNSIFR